MHPTTPHQTRSDPQQRGAGPSRRAIRGVAAALGALVLLLGVTACGGTDDDAADDASGGGSDSGEVSVEGDDEGTCTDLADAAGEAVDIELVARAPYSDAGSHGTGQDRGFVCSFEDGDGTIQASTSTLHWRDEADLEADEADLQATELYEAFQPTGGGSGYTVLLEGDTSAAVVLYRDGWQWSFQVNQLDPEADPADRPTEAALQEAIVALAEAVDPDSLDLEVVEEEPETSDDGSTDGGGDSDDESTDGGGEGEA